MNLRRLKYFVKSIEIGSLTQAAEVLFVAQPALSQQLSVLEHELKQTLLIRNKRGVQPTEAGKVLYRKAQLILRLCEQAHMEVQTAGQNLSGSVSIGLAQCSMAEQLAIPLLKAVRDAYPDISLNLNQNSGVRQSELVMNGNLDLALLGTSLYGTTMPHGILFSPLLEEELYLVSNQITVENGEIELEDVMEMDLVLPNRNHFLRKTVDDAFIRIGSTPRIVAEISTNVTLNQAVIAGIGSTILPASVALPLSDSSSKLRHARIQPILVTTLALCESKSLSLSLPAQAVKQTILNILAQHALTLRMRHDRGFISPHLPASEKI
ncbi:nitrogen assimilation transcriptional regulator NAC [Acerihabitans sp.]|uniref:nitrogen assimilation transcriptional regulator NAC n=1 Tax=Acerihabitans sp. TaxID=2811394 RepID=UPI002EDAFF4C